MDEDQTKPQGQSSMTWLYLLIGIVAVLGILYYLGMDSNSSQEQAAQEESINLENSENIPNGNPSALSPSRETTPDENIEAGNGEVNSAMDENSSNIKEFSVNMGAFYYKPSTMSVNVGDTVKITLTNDGGMHDFVLDEFNVKSAVIQTGETTTVTFVADKVGTYEFYCSVGDHRAKGMVGTLTVKWRPNPGNPKK